MAVMEENNISVCWVGNDCEAEENERELKRWKINLKV